jgi:hypothetical protein
VANKAGKMTSHFRKLCGYFRNPICPPQPLDLGGSLAQGGGRCTRGRSFHPVRDLYDAACVSGVQAPFQEFQFLLEVGMELLQNPIDELEIAQTPLNEFFDVDRRVVYVQWG